MPAIPDSAIEYLKARYSDFGRHYHNWRHIDSMLRDFEALKRLSLIDDVASVEVAILFHDAVYDPKQDDNEFRSATLMNLMLDQTPDPLTMGRANALILATKSHHLPLWSDRRRRKDASLFLDMDLAILGSDTSDYLDYARAIRSEYAFVPETTFNVGRSAVLQSFLARPRIYLSDIYYEAREARARDNIQREITLLAQPTTKAMDTANDQESVVGNYVPLTGHAPRTPPPSPKKK